MTSVESILAEYRRADFEKRLNLFLECPSLRDWFMEIDQSENVSLQNRKKDIRCTASGVIGKRIRRWIHTYTME